MNVTQKGDSLHQFNESEAAIEKLLRYLLQEIEGFKYSMSLRVEFMRKIYGVEAYSFACFNYPNELDLNKDGKILFERINGCLTEDSGWKIKANMNQ